MPDYTTYNPTFSFFRSTIGYGFNNYGSDLTKSILASEGEEALSALQDHLAGMLTEFIFDGNLVHIRSKKLSIRSLQEALEHDFREERISMLSYLGNISLFTRCVLPGNPNHVSLSTSADIEIAHVAYAHVVDEQQEYAPLADPEYRLLKDRTIEIADVLSTITENDIKGNHEQDTGKIVTIDQLTLEQEQRNALSIAEQILRITD